jgi:plasmid maintenance system antidote protein VapI
MNLDSMTEETIGDYIFNRIMAPTELSLREVSEVLQVSHVTVWNVLKGKERLSLELAYRIESVFGEPAKGLVKWRMREHLRAVKRKLRGIEFERVDPLPVEEVDSVPSDHEAHDGYENRTEDLVPA